MQLSEDGTKKLYPELEPRQRAEAAENLSRRIVLQTDPIDNLAEILKVSRDDGTPLEELLPEECKQKHRALMAEFVKEDDETPAEEAKDEKRRFGLRSLTTEVS